MFPQSEILFCYILDITNYGEISKHRIMRKRVLTLPRHLWRSAETAYARTNLLII